MLYPSLTANTLTEGRRMMEGWYNTNAYYCHPPRHQMLQLGEHRHLTIIRSL